MTLCVTLYVIRFAPSLCTVDRLVPQHSHAYIPKWRLQGFNNVLNEPFTRLIWCHCVGHTLRCTGRNRSVMLWRSNGEFHIGKLHRYPALPQTLTNATRPSGSTLCSVLQSILIPSEEGNNQVSNISEAFRPKFWWYLLASLLCFIKSWMNSTLHSSQLLESNWSCWWQDTLTILRIILEYPITPSLWLGMSQREHMYPFIVFVVLPLS